MLSTDRRGPSRLVPETARCNWCNGRSIVGGVSLIYGIEFVFICRAISSGGHPHLHARCTSNTQPPRLTRTPEEC